MVTALERVKCGVLEEQVFVLKGLFTPRTGA